MRIRCFAALVALASLLTFPAPGHAQQKRLLEFGWDEPDTAFLRKHIAEIEKRPFDGTVFHLNFKADDGSMQNYVWHTWGTRAFTEADFQHAIEDLKNTPLTKFTHNFLRFNTTPASRTSPAMPASPPASPGTARPPASSSTSSSTTGSSSTFQSSATRRTSPLTHTPRWPASAAAR